MIFRKKSENLHWNLRILSVKVYSNVTEAS